MPRFGKHVGVACVVLALLGCARQPSSPEWRLLGGGSEQQYYSRIGEIDQSNVKNLGLAWYADMETADGLVGQPLVADGVIYQSGPPGRIFANDLKTGKSLWVFNPEITYADGTTWTGFWGTHVNRGLAIDGDNIYVASHCRILAVSRKTHQQVWAAQSCDPTKQIGINGAPRVGGGRVYIGNTSGDLGGERGYVDAFDGKTGKHLWRFYTMPGDPSKPFENEQMAIATKTWGTNYWKYVKGGVSPWDAITYDEKTDTLYFGTDGPAPWSPDQRAPDAGDELFTDSILAVDAKTGKYKWHFQTVQHDGWNLAATMHLMLADLPMKEGTRRVVMTAPKNGFFYVLDAESGKFIHARNYVPVNWTKGLDPVTGRPIASDEANYWEKPGQEVVPLPGDPGAHNWQAMAFSPENRLVYIPATVIPVLMKVDPKSAGGVDADYYYGFRANAKVKARGELVAWDPVTQTAKWRATRPVPTNGGILATAGNLVFQGTGDGKFEAYAADTGRKLWSFDVGGTILAAPTTVTVDGDQYLIVASGNGGSSGSRGTPGSITTRRAQGPARLLAFKLNGSAKLPVVQAQPFPKPSSPRPDKALAARGRGLFIGNYCGTCHGADGIGISPGIPDLRRMTPETSALMSEIVIRGLYRPNGMPSFPDLRDSDIDALRAFAMKRAWEEHDRQAAGDNSPSLISSNQK
jgi:PQQ-dependent dehydrogenase (methanol/ethanol family)